MWSIPIVEALIGAGGAVAASKISSGASKRAAETQLQGSREAEALERYRLAQQQRQWEAEQQRQRELELRRREEADREYAIKAYEQALRQAEEERRAPYRAIGRAALLTLGNILGFKGLDRLGRPDLSEAASRTVAAMSWPQPSAPETPPALIAGGPVLAGAVAGELVRPARLVVPATEPNYEPATSWPSRTLGSAMGLRPVRRRSA